MLHYYDIFNSYKILAHENYEIVRSNVWGHESGDFPQPAIAW